MNKFFTNVGNTLGLGPRGSPPTSTLSVSQPNQPPSDFDYSDINTIPGSLQPAFNNLKNAINKKKGILKGYEGLYATLQSMNGLLDTYISNHANTIENASNLQADKTRLEKERDDLLNQPRSDPEDQAKIAKLNEEIEGKKSEIQQLSEQQSLDVNKMNAIGILLQEATDEINAMYPTDNTDITSIQTLINEMKIKLGSVPIVQEPEVNYGDVYNPQNTNRIDTEGGYRYSSSQMRRKSTAKRSSASGSSSSKRRRNKKRTAKRMMLGGKRMKKTKSTKRKHNKKC
jgi:hypothetical protein